MATQIHARPGCLDESSKRRWDQVVRTWLPQLRRFVVRRLPGTGSEFDPDEIVQEVLCRAMDGLVRGTFDPGRPIWPYLMGTAANVLSESRRRRERHRRLARALSEGAAPECSAISADSPFAMMAARFVEVWLTDQPAITRDVWQRVFLASEPERDVAMALCISRRRLRAIEAELQRRVRRLPAASRDVPRIVRERGPK
jgi:DNA-directed RNA polymerase specialized sigma24 family protein